MASRTESCDKRIDEQLQNRIEQFDKGMRWYNAWSEANNTERADNALERLRELPLALTVDRVIKVELSYGGPQDYLEYFVDKDADVYRVTYHFLDWFDGAERNLVGDDFRIAVEYLELVAGDIYTLLET